MVVYCLRVLFVLNCMLENFLLSISVLLMFYVVFFSFQEIKQFFSIQPLKFGNLIYMCTVGLFHEYTFIVLPFFFS